MRMLDVRMCFLFQKLQHRAHRWTHRTLLVLLPLVIEYLQFIVLYRIQLATRSRDCTLYIVYRLNVIYINWTRSSKFLLEFPDTKPYGKCQATTTKKLYMSFKRFNYGAAFICFYFLATLLFIWLMLLLLLLILLPMAYVLQYSTQECLNTQ